MGRRVVVSFALESRFLKNAVSALHWSRAFRSLSCFGGSTTRTSAVPSGMFRLSDVVRETDRVLTGL